MNEKQQDQEKENLITKLLKEKEDQDIKLEKVLETMEEMKKEIIQLKNKSNKIVNSTQNAENIQNNNNCNNKIQNVHNEIKIIAYGKEDLSHILEKDYKMILNKGFKSVPALMESIHFNKNKPENHNIYISNMRDNHVLIYDGNEWQLKERDDLLQEIVYNKSDILNKKFDELVDQLDEFTIRKFNRFLDKKDDDAIINSIKKDLKLLMYNKRKIVENTKNQLLNIE